MTNESQFKDWVQKSLRAKGWFVRKIVESFSSGMPDMYVCKDGRSIWIEAKFVSALPAKATTGVLKHKFSAMQISVGKDLKKAGAEVIGIIGYVEGRSVKVMTVEVERWNEEFPKEIFLKEAEDKFIDKF